MARDKSQSSLWNALPKVELHCHLEGSIRLRTIVQEYQRQKLDLPAGGEEELRKYFLIEQPADSLDAFIAVMDRQKVILHDPQAIQRIAREVVLDKSDSNVKLLEVRWSPSYISAGGKHEYKDILQAVQSGIEEGISEAKGLGKEIYVYQICIAVPVFGNEELQKTVEFAIEQRNKFAGFDIAGSNEHIGSYAPYFDQIHAAGIPITAHAAESGPAEEARDAVEKLHAVRIGHGTHIAQSHGVYHLIQSREIHVECCPISNIRTSSVKNMENHPIKKFLEDGLSVSISSDDPGVFGNKLEDDYTQLSDTFGFGVSEFFQMNRHGLAASFCPEATKEKLMQKYFSPEMEEEFSARQAQDIRL